MDIRPGASPGSIFGAADNNPLVQSFDEESPDSVLNPDGSVGYPSSKAVEGARRDCRAFKDTHGHGAARRYR